MNGGEELAGVVGLGKSDPHMTWEKEGASGRRGELIWRSIATKNEQRLRAASYGGYKATTTWGKP